MSANDPTLIVLGRRPRGRPRLEERRDSSVSVWLRPSEHDRLIQLAKKHGLSLSATVRALVLKRGP